MLSARRSIGANRTLNGIRRLATQAKFSSLEVPQDYVSRTPPY